MRRILLISLVLAFFGCENAANKKLPILGRHEYNSRTEGLKVITDTVYYTVPKFEFLSHRNTPISTKNIEGKITVADFFFTTCPTICPVMSKNMRKVSQEFKTNDKVAFLSFSIDALHDSVPNLNKYATKLNVENPNWHFLECERKKTFKLAKGFMISAEEDKNAPGGLIHSGAFIILDGKQRIRAYYDGTKEEDIEKVIEDIKILLNEQ